MHKLILAAAITLLTGCAVTKDGTPAPVNAPQAAEQCRAQPDLEWCKPHGH